MWHFEVNPDNLETQLEELMDKMVAEPPGETEESKANNSEPTGQRHRRQATKDWSGVIGLQWINIDIYRVQECFITFFHLNMKRVEKV